MEREGIPPGTLAGANLARNLPSGTFLALPSHPEGNSRYDSPG
jgi:hypothetical protein